MKRCSLSLLTIILLLTSSSCIKQKTIIKVNEDGSGSLVVTTIFSAQVVTMIEEQLKSMREQFAEADMPMDMPFPTNIFFNEDLLRAQADTYGLDVSYVRGKPYNKSGERGAVALYSFKNINDLVVPASGLDMEGMSSALMTGEGTSSKPVDLSKAYTFSITNQDDNAQLAIALPKMAELKEIDPEELEENKTMLSEPIDEQEMAAMQAAGNPMGITGSETAAQMVEKMMGDSELSLEIIVNGVVDETNAEFRNPAKPNRFRLINIDFSKLLAQNDLAYLITALADDDGPDFFSNPTALRNIPGVIIETNQPVTITFHTATKSADSEAP